MRKTIGGFAAAALVAGAAWAGDAPAPNDAVEIRFAVKVGDVMRFRETESSSTEIGGKKYSASETSQDFTLTVKAVRPDDGLDVDATLDRVQLKMFNSKTQAWSEIDTSKPAPAGADMQTQMVGDVSRAMIGAAFKVVLDAHGAPTAVSGLREAVGPRLKDNPMAAMMPVDQILGDEACMKLARSLFAAAPAGSHAVGAKWTAEEKAEVSDQPLEFSVEATRAAATAADATATSKYAWKPGAKATAGGAKAVGGGDATSKFSRQDGFVLSMKRHLEANRETPAMKATSHTDTTIERLPPAAAKAADPPTKK